ncbi:WD40 repeat domain-containing protein [Streptomyces sp. NPDC101150]|uniref:WD40 repeat domain-containing protein n=1 Tax=Streptomyces sp. NPDC101150 TaxID=3366114 RepID=UPI0037F4268E
MTDERLMAGFRGHTHHGFRGTSPVIELDGVPVLVSMDIDGVLWTCDLRAGTCAQRPLELDAAAPDDDWYREIGLLDDDADEDEDWRPEFEIDVWGIVSVFTTGHLGGRPVVVTGGGRFDLARFDEDMMGGAVRVWDLRTGRKIGKTLTGHELGVCSLAAVPYERGLLVVSSSEEGTLLAWDVATGERLAEIEGSYNGAMGAALIDGRPIAVTGGHDSFVQAWDILSGEPLGEPLTGIEPVVRAIAITRTDGRTVVVGGGDDHALRVWDLESQKPAGPPLTGHTDSIETLGTATVAGRTIAITGSRDGTTRIWDLARGEQIGEPLDGRHLHTCIGIAGTPVAVTAGSGNGILIWDLTRAAPAAPEQLR